MSHIEALRAAFRDHGIERVAIVDDGYDPPTASGIPENDRRQFRTHLTDAREERENGDAIELLEGKGLVFEKDVAEQLDDGDFLGKAWAIYANAERASPVWTLLNRLFSSYEVGRHDKLDALVGLETLVADVSGTKPTAFDSSVEPSQLLGYDLIFLDFYLEAPDGGAPESHAAARLRSVEFLKGVVAEAQGTLPLVMLISSEAQAGDLIDFRKQAGILASAIQFLPKIHAEKDVFRAGLVLLGLVERRHDVRALWKLLDLWQQSVRAASTELMELVLELDLPDYTYLQASRLTNERVPLAHYLVWLFNGYQSNLVEQKLHNAMAAKTIGSINLKGTMPGRIAPTNAISTLYASITTSVVPMSLDEFKPAAWAGDVFVRADRWHEIGGDAAPGPVIAGADAMPEVIAVVTPACDLVPERSKSLRAVTTIAGKLHPLEHALHPSTHFIIIRDKPFHVGWEPKWPMTIPIDKMNGDTALDGTYRWVGRLRELYHADLQQSFVRDVGRVGLPVAPPLPQWHGVRVLAKSGTSHREILLLGSDERAAWTYFSTTEKSDRTLHLREDVVWQIRDAVLNLIEGATDRPSVKLRENVGKNEFVRTMQHPIAFKKDISDLGAIGVRIKRVPLISDEDGAACELPILVVFGNDAAA